MEKKTEKFALLMTKTEQKQLVALAKKRGISKGEVVRQMIRRASARKGA